MNPFKKPGEAPPDRKESREKRKVEYRFYFAPHANAEDYEKMRDEIPSSDVIVFEMMGHEPYQQKYFQLVADGKTSPDRMREFFASRGEEPGVSLILSDLLYKTKKKVLFVDLPAGHPLIQEHKKVIDALTQDQALFERGRFDEAMQGRRASIERGARMIEAREAWIKEHLTTGLPRIIKDDPKLKSKPLVRALVQLGALHTSVFRDIGKTHPASRTTGRAIEIFGSVHQGERSLLWNKPLEDLTVARSLLEIELTERCLPFGDEKVTKNQAIAQFLTSRLSLDQIREISMDIQKQYSGAQINPATTIENACRRFGVTLPQTEEEANALIEERFGKDSAYAKALIAL